MTMPANIADFKTQFDRDFLYGTGLDTVRDSDIQRALNEAGSVYNNALFTNDPAGVDEQKIAYLYASAHFLVLNVQMAGGLSTIKGRGVLSRGGGITQSKNVGDVSVAYVIPPSILESPILNQLLRTDYGLTYIQMVTSRLVAGAMLVGGFNDVTVGPNVIEQV